MDEMLKKFEALYRAEIKKYNTYEEWAQQHTCFDIWADLMEQAGHVFNQDEGVEPTPEVEKIMDRIDMERFGLKTSDEY